VGIIREGRLVEVSDIRSLQQNNYKKIRLNVSGENPVSAELPGISNLQNENGSVQFFFRGDINTILRKLASTDVKDISIEEPSLEEIFMHYYE